MSLSKTIIRREYSNNIELPDSIHPVLQRVYAARNIRSIDDIDYSLASLLPFNDLAGVESAVRLLIEAIKSKQRI